MQVHANPQGPVSPTQQEDYEIGGYADCSLCDLAVGQANGHFNMIKEGDRVMLGLSGGKDSLTMLHCLLQLQKRSPYKFDLACVTVDPQTNGFDPRYALLFLSYAF